MNFRSEYKAQLSENGNISHDSGIMMAGSCFSDNIGPVKHLRDGIEENNLSKSILNVAIHEIIRKFDFAGYFPAYEIVTDDLRDYRFYNSDLAHPNQMAIEYVWEKFCDTYFDNSVKKEMKEVEQWFRKKEHVVLHPGSPAHQKFVNSLEKETEKILKKYPHLSEF